MPRHELGALLAGTAVVPVLVVDSFDTGVGLARALVAGGLAVLEITLRTSAAVEVIRAIDREVEGAVVGAGTVLDPEQYRAAERAGARFIVSPGATERLLAHAQASETPFLAGWLLAPATLAPASAAWPVQGVTLVVSRLAL